METTDEKLSHLVRVVDKMELQIQRMASDQESEKGTRRRRNDELDKKFEHFENVISGKEGIFIRLALLESVQSDLKASRNRNIAMAIPLILLVVKAIIDFIVK